MQAPRYRSIVALLDSRQSGYIRKNDPCQLLFTATLLADRDLVQRHQVTKIRGISPNKRSSYVIESSVDGFAVASHSNRCLSIIKTGKMEKITDIEFNQRTVWTLAVHPFDSRFIATGNMGGQVAIFKDFDMYRSVNTVRTSRVASITFHPSRRIVCFAIQHQIYVWNWQDNVIEHTIDNGENNRFKLVKFNPGNGMLITGTTYDNDRLYKGHFYHYDESLTMPKITLYRLFDIISMVLHNLEIFESDRDLFVHWTAALKLMRWWTPPPEDQSGMDNVRTSVPEKNNDLTLTVKVFADKVRELQSTIPDFFTHLMQLDPAQLNIRLEMCKLRTILVYYHRERLKLSKEYAPFYATDKALLDMIEQLHGLLLVRNANPMLIRRGRFCIVRHNHLRLQAWEFVDDKYPDLTQEWRNIITHAYIHNDSTVEITRCGSLIASFRELAWGRFEILVQSLERHTFADKLFTFENFQDAHIMSLSISPSRQYLLVGMRSWHMFGYFLHITADQSIARKTLTTFVDPIGGSRDGVIDSDGRNFDGAFNPIEYCGVDTGVVSCLRWMARPGDGAIIGYRSHHLRYIGYSKLR